MLWDANTSIGGVEHAPTPGCGHRDNTFTPQRSTVAAISVSLTEEVAITLLAIPMLAIPCNFT